MSIKRLTIDERARYLIGEAVMRRIQKSERDPAAMSDIRALCNWIETWLTADELDAVTRGTGLIFDDELAKALQGGIVPSDDKDDVPF
jgi:hypothetical protein